MSTLALDLHCEAVPTEEDPVLAAILRAPLVPLSEEENAELDAIERRTTRWIPHDELVATLGPNDDP